jgi:predicted MFS family arabinose efflux permease
MTRRNRDPEQREAAAVTAGSGPVTRPAGPVTAAGSGSLVDRMVPAHLTCRVGAHASTGQRNAWPAVTESRGRSPRIGLIAAGAMFFANFAAYTYIGPLLHARAGLGAGAVTLVLLGFGLAGAASNFTAGITVRTHLRATLMGSGLLIAVSALLLAAVTGARPLTIALMAIWGAGYGAVPVAAQSWMARAMPANVEGGLALFVSALQGSLAAGSAVGGIVYDAKGPGGVLIVAGVIAALGALTLLSRAGAAISAPPAGSPDPAPEPGPASALPQAAIDGAGNRA